MMYEDSPHIEEIIEEDEVEKEVKKEFEEYRREIEAVTTLPGFNKDSGKMAQVLRIMEKAIGKWEEDEEDVGSNDYRRRCLWEFKRRHDNYEKIIEKAEEDFYKRRENDARRQMQAQPEDSHRRQRGFDSEIEKRSLKTPRLKAGRSSYTKKPQKKYLPGEKALAEIRRYQKSTDLLIQKAPFARLVHEIVREATSSSGDYRVRADALMALQEGAEAFMVEMFEGSTLICNHAKRVTLMPTDIQLYRRLCLKNL